MSSSDPKGPTRHGEGNAPAEDLAETRVPPSDEMAETFVEKKRQSTAGDVTKASREQSTGSSQSSAKSGSASGKKKIKQLGDFKLVKKLGQGGMGTVYLASQVSLDRKVALKTLSKDFAKQEDFVKRFIREARSMAKLQHPNIVQVYAADSAHGVYYAAIEYIDGRSMQDWMDDKKQLSVGDGLYVTLICAAALKQAHDQNMIHRDIKPDNILVTSRGVVKVADFGLAKAVDEDVSMTQSGTGLGTPLYMAPEQARNAKHVDKRSDIYALGSTLYYFLTGALPFTGDNTLELIMAKEKGTFKSARKLNSQVPERLDLMIDKMMAKDVGHRYADCAEIIQDIQSLNLASPALSFIEGADSVMLTGSLGGGSGPTTKLPPKKRAEKQITSAEDAERAEAKGRPDLSSEEWIVRHTVGGKITMSKMTTPQITAGLQGGTLDLKIKLKKNAKEQFSPIAKFPQFENVAEKRAVRDKADARSQDVKSIYTKLDKQDRRRKTWRWFFNLIGNIRGFIGLIIWLAVVAGIGWAAWVYGWPLVQDFFKNN